jgi:hypothetical protein
MTSAAAGVRRSPSSQQRWTDGRSLSGQRYRHHGHTRRNEVVQRGFSDARPPASGLINETNRVNSGGA